LELSDRQLATLGERIRKAREDAGMLQDDLAGRLGCDKSTISKYETNGRTPTPETLAKIADITGTSADLLLGRDQYLAPTGNPRLDFTRQELLDMLDKAGRTGTPEQLAALMLLAQMIVDSNEKGGDKH
jgi:transcriptional regulator with XRE-family HTH domain